jgi:hypothetical protein
VLPIQEAPRPHVVKLQPSAIIPQQVDQEIQEASRPHVVKLEPNVIVSQMQYQQVPEARRPHVIKLHTKNPQHEYQQVIPGQQYQLTVPQQDSHQTLREKNISWNINNMVQKRIRDSLPNVLSGLQTEQVARQTKVKQEPIKRVTHTVTSTSSQVSPSHHYVQDTVIGENISESGVLDISEDIILPETSPIFIEETRENKPVWTVTRVKTSQTVKKPSVELQDGSVIKTSALKKVRRKLSNKDKMRLKNKKRMLLKTLDKELHRNEEKKRRVLLKPAPEVTIEKSEDLIHENEQEEVTSTPTITFDFRNGLEDGNIEEELNENEKKAISLKEAYDRHIKKINVEEPSENREPGNRLLEMMLEDYEDRHYLDSNQLRGEE